MNAKDIADRKHVFRSTTNNWTIFVTYDENDVGIAKFYSKRYEEAIASYLKVSDDDVDVEFNVWEALNAMCREDASKYDECVARYRRLFPDGERIFSGQDDGVGTDVDAKTSHDDTTTRADVEERNSEDDDSDDDEVTNSIDRAAMRSTGTYNCDEDNVRSRRDDDDKPLTQTTPHDDATSKGQLTAHDKEVRFLRKKLREISALERKLDSKECLNNDQRAKLSRKPRYEGRLRYVLAS